MDSTACNFDASATDEDGSCSYAEELYNCDKVCLVDTDGDGVCDELEVMGCQNPSACNYDDKPPTMDCVCLRDCIVPATGIA